MTLVEATRKEQVRFLEAKLALDRRFRLGGDYLPEYTFTIGFEEPLASIAWQVIRERVEGGEMECFWLRVGRRFQHPIPLDLAGVRGLAEGWIGEKGVSGCWRSGSAVLEVTNFRSEESAEVVVHLRRQIGQEKVEGMRT